MGLSFTIPAGPRQSSHFQIRVPRDSCPYFTLRFETPPTWRARSLYLVYPPGTGWPGYTPVVFNIIHRHGSHRKHPVSIVVVQLFHLPSNGLRNTVSNSNSFVVEACLPRCCIATAVVSLLVSSSLPSSGPICHNMKISRTRYSLAIPLQKLCGSFVVTSGSNWKRVITE
jgi:hypothetical protein